MKHWMFSFLAYLKKIVCNIGLRKKALCNYLRTKNKHPLQGLHCVKINFDQLLVFLPTA